MAVELDARAAGARRLKDKVCVVTGGGQGIGVRRKVDDFDWLVEMNYFLRYFLAT